MNVLRLGFENFRNLCPGEIFPGETINVIHGSNAQGKTNLLEAIWLFTGGHSFRGTKDSELPVLKDGKNAPAASLSMTLFTEGREQELRLELRDGRRSSVINGVEKKTGSALVGKFCAVIFSPEHLLLVKEGPSRRRAFLVHGEILTTKQNAAEHGYGLPAVKYILNQLGAEYTFAYHDGWFQFVAEIQE